MRRAGSVPPMALCLAAVLVLLGAVAPVHAGTGAIAVAVPVAGIRVDGRFDDWPDGMTTYPITCTEWIRGPAVENDPSASFRIGYEPQANALLLAVSVRDPSLVV